MSQVKGQDSAFRFPLPSIAVGLITGFASCGGAAGAWLTVTASLLLCTGEIRNLSAHMASGLRTPWWALLGPLHTQNTVQLCCPTKAGTLAVAGPAISIHCSWPKLGESSAGIRGHDCCRWCSGSDGGAAGPSPGLVTGGFSLGVDPYKNLFVRDMNSINLVGD